MPSRIVDEDGNEVSVPRVGEGGGGSTPTLAEVLAAGNETGAHLILGPAEPYGTAPRLDLSGGPSLNLLGGNGLNDGSDEPGGDIVMAAGAGSEAGSTAGAALELHGTGSVGPIGQGGAVDIKAGDASTGSGLQGGDVLVQPGAGDGAGRNGLVFLNLPISDPHVAGALYSSSGIVMVSTG